MISAALTLLELLARFQYHRLMDSTSQPWFGCRNLRILVNHVGVCIHNGLRFLGVQFRPVALAFRE